MNKAYLNSNRTEAGDEVYTPFYAVEPILEFLSKDEIIWCPFDKEWSAFVQLLTEKGYKVIHSDISENKDFFNYEPDKYDIIISNPPFSKKNQVLERAYKLGKPFMLLLPIQTLQSKKRVKLFDKYGLELLCFDSRIDYHTRQNFNTTTKGNHFASAYFCNKVLFSRLTFKELKKYERPLINGGIK